MQNIKQFAVKHSVVIVMLALIVVFSFTGSSFLTVKNLTNLINQNTYFLIASVGLAFVMIGGGIDLSVGYQMSMVGVVTAILMTEMKLPVPLCMLTGLLLGTLLGTINGLIVTKLKVFPLIVTLGMSTVFQGISYQITQAKTYRSFPDFLFALATIDMIAKANTTSSSFGPGTEFTCMTAAIIGGISFKGGKGGMLGLVVGVFVLQILGNGMQLAGWGTYSQYIVKGLILLLAIALDGVQLRPEAVRKKE